MNTLLKAVLISLWLPVLVLAVSLARFGTGFVTAPAEGYATLATQLGVGWLGVIPLTMALMLLKPLSGLWFGICAAVLGILAVAAFIVGGLFGEAGVVSSLISLAIPAFIVYFVMRTGKGGGSGSRSKAKPAASAAKPRPSKA